MIVDCDKCGGRFKVRPKTKRLQGKDEKVYFTCKHCKHEYVAFYQNRKTEELKKKIRGIEHSIQRLPANKGDNLIKKLKKTKQELNKEMDRLKSKYD